MSYILDALKKSEQQRATLNIPTASQESVPQSTTETSRFRLPLVMLLVILSAGWFVTHQLQKPDNHKPAPINSKPVVSESVASKQIGSEKAISKKSISGQIPGSSAAPSPIATPVAPVRQTALAQPRKRGNTASNTAPKQKNKNRSHAQPEVTANNMPKQTSGSHIESNAVPVFKPITPVSPVSRSVIPFPDIGDDNTQAASANEGVHSLSELPFAVQQSLPAINIEGHIYDENPATRMIIVNGKISHEKQAVGNGLKLEEITPDGVILSYQGHVFHMGVFDR